MDAFCPHCKTKYDVEREDIGRSVDCTVCHKTFSVEIAQPKPQMKTGGKSQCASSTPERKKTMKYNDVSFLLARAMIKGIFYVWTLFCIGFAVFVWAKIPEEHRWYMYLLSFAAWLIGDLLYSLAMLVFEIVKHLREIRDSLNR